MIIRALLGIATWLFFFASSLQEAGAYTAKVHERSVRAGAEACERDHSLRIADRDLRNMIIGVREPDRWSPAALQIAKQRVEPGSYGTRRGINLERIVIQSLHGSPNPTRPAYSDSTDDQELKKQAIRIPDSELLSNRFPLDVYSYDTHQTVRNKMLTNASEFLCVSFAHKDDAQSARKFGNLLHMIGDTYTASHVQRSPPEGSDDNCGTEKIEWQFSMDLISWKKHAVADREDGDWRFRCLVDHTSQLMKMWWTGRQAVVEEPDETRKLKRSNEEVEGIVDFLCAKVFKEEPEVLRSPAGGAAAEYSSTSGNDNWTLLTRLWKRQPVATPIQPVGLTGSLEAKEFVKSVNDGLRRRRSSMQFSYPSREAADFCEDAGHREVLPTALRCTSQEIEWAMSDSDDVSGLWIPSRGAGDR